MIAPRRNRNLYCGIEPHTDPSAEGAWNVKDLAQSDWYVTDVFDGTYVNRDAINDLIGLETRLYCSNQKTNGS